MSSVQISPAPAQTPALHPAEQQGVAGGAGAGLGGGQGGQRHVPPGHAAGQDCQVRPHKCHAALQPCYTLLHQGMQTSTLLISILRD